MKIFLIILLILIVIPWISSEGIEINSETCHLMREYIEGNRIVCVYDCPSGRIIVSVNNTEMCPATITK